MNLFGRKAETDHAPLVWRTEKRRIGELVEWDHNPRQLTEKQAHDLGESLRKFGYVEEIVVNADGRSIIGGHMRRKVALAQALLDPDAMVDVRVPSRPLTEQEGIELAIRLNKNTGEWDFDKLAEFDVPALREWGFEDKDFHFDFLAKTSSGREDESPPEPAKDAVVSRPGDLWILGPHRLLCGDSTQKADVERLFDGKQASMTFTDPPYGVAYRDTGAGAWDAEKLAKKKAGELEPRFDAMANDELSEPELLDFLVAYMSIQPLADNAAQYVCHASLRAHVFREALLRSGYEIRAELIWAKSRPGFNFAHYKHQHEPIYYAAPSGDSVAWYGNQTQVTLWEVASESGAVYEHPTQKPVALAQRAIQNSSQPGEVVYEPFAGSGSTIIAAQAAERVCYALEIAPAYVDVAVVRWEKYANGQATLSDGRSFAAVARERLA